MNAHALHRFAAGARAATATGVAVIAVGLAVAACEGSRGSRSPAPRAGADAVAPRPDGRAPAATTTVEIATTPPLVADDAEPGDAGAPPTSIERAPLPPCSDAPDAGESAPGCLWRGFTFVRDQPDVKVTLETRSSGCIEPRIRADLDALADNALRALRAAGWISFMSAHCRTELHECDLQGTVTWRGHVFEVVVNHEGIGVVSDDRGATAWFATGDSGGCND